MERFLESLQKIMDNESVRIITIELDLDGTFFYGKIIKITKSLFPTFNLFPPLNITLFQCLMEIKKLASQKNKLFQVNICSTGNILELDQDQRKKIYILLMMHVLVQAVIWHRFDLFLLQLRMRTNLRRATLNEIRTGRVKSWTCGIQQKVILFFLIVDEIRLVF